MQASDAELIATDTRQLLSPITRYVTLGFETSGLEPQADSLVQAAAVRVDGTQASPAGVYLKPYIDDFAKVSGDVLRLSQVMGPDRFYPVTVDRLLSGMDVAKLGEWLAAQVLWDERESRWSSPTDVYVVCHGYCNFWHKWLLPICSWFQQLNVFDTALIDRAVVLRRPRYAGETCRDWLAALASTPAAGRWGILSGANERWSLMSRAEMDASPAWANAEATRRLFVRLRGE